MPAVLKVSAEFSRSEDGPVSLVRILDTPPFDLGAEKKSVRHHAIVAEVEIDHRPGAAAAEAVGEVTRIDERTGGGALDRRFRGVGGVGFVLVRALRSDAE